MEIMDRGREPRSSTTHLPYPILYGYGYAMPLYYSKYILYNVNQLSVFLWYANV